MAWVYNDWDTSRSVSSRVLKHLSICGNWRKYPTQNVGFFASKLTPNWKCLVLLWCMKGVLYICLTSLNCAPVMSQEINGHWFWQDKAEQIHINNIKRMQHVHDIIVSNLHVGLCALWRRFPCYSLFFKVCCLVLLHLTCCTSCC